MKNSLVELIDQNRRILLESRRDLERIYFRLEKLNEQILESRNWLEKEKADCFRLLQLHSKDYDLKHTQM
jgi:hypothetical protein